MKIQELQDILEKLDIKGKDMSSSKISVIIPIYNTEEYIEECILSIVNQTFSDFEVICIDDGSTDDTLNILNRFASEDDRIKIIHLNQNYGVSYARNIGLNEAKGDYVLFIDSDDFLEYNALGEVYSLAKKLSADIVIFKLQNFDNITGEKIYRKNFEMNFLKERVGEEVFNFSRVVDYFFKISPTLPGKLFKRTLISDLHFVENLIFEDNPFFISVFLKANRIYFYDKHLYYRRLREDSITHSFFDSFSDCVEIYDIIRNVLEENQVYDILKEQLIKNQCKDIFNRFSQVDNNNKKEFFDKIKYSFSNLKEKLENDRSLANSDEKTRVIFYSAIEAKTEVEYELMVNNYLLTKKVNSMKKDNEKMKKNNEKMKKQIETLDKNYSAILESNSWKITEPLRKIFNKK